MDTRNVKVDGMSSAVLTGTKEVKIGGMSVGVFAVFGGITLLGTYLGVVPNNMIVGFAITLTLGFLLNWLGNTTKFLKTIGAPAILCIIVPALLAQLGLFPEKGVKIVEDFYTGYGYIDYFIAALIAGSILSMDRNILLKAGARYAIPLIVGLACALLVSGGIGALVGYGFNKSILEVSIPIMGGGIGAGAIPISEMYANAAGGSSDAYISVIMPAVIVGNLLAIIMAVILSAAGRNKDKPFKGFSGQGVLLRSEEWRLKEEVKKTQATYVNLAIGLLVSGALYIFGYIISKTLIPSIHAYAWTILTAALIKIFNLCPQSVQDAAGDWYEFLAYFGTPVILVCLSFSVIDVPQIVAVVTNPSYLLVTVITIVVAALAAGFGGWLVSMYFVEAAITAGLCMANAGGSGDVAVLGAADRMNLMPFAQISSRIGGAIVLIIVSFLIPILM